MHYNGEQEMDDLLFAHHMCRMSKEEKVPHL